MFTCLKVRLLIGVLIVGLAGAAAANAQVLYGSLTGNVTDQTGAILPGIKVEVSNNATGVTKMLITDERGSYLFSDLQAGVYKVAISAASFQTYSRDGVSITANAIVRINAVLQVAGVTGTVAVTETLTAIVLQTDRADINVNQS